ncbi:DgyrCDS7370 [Dimorphilus gyrociliatus]|uniref:DgyrCDS7370 n=1 Tax=Dimorphilus gyrociliatus TaxID=2664684 RepID=A0A7I8VR18_9ANNE|nr:DgyrCDS7370 [Dimorphilus gyrociliatus]
MKRRQIGTVGKQTTTPEGNSNNVQHQEGVECPWKEALIVLSVSLLVVFVLVPLLAFSWPIPPRTDLHWWQTGVIYQVYPRSFQDSNSDGIGDLKGIESRLDYLKWLGVSGVWISPFYKSPMADFGYDISDYKDVDPIFGTLSDFDDLIKAAHEKGLKIIIDQVPNHTSNQHKWFLESKKDPKSKYADYYIWHKGIDMGNGKRKPPNNWLNFFKGSAWTWDEDRQAYYFHQFTKEQPDLNYRNPAVRQEILDTFKFWLDRGVDGFRVDVAPLLLEEEHLKDEPLSNIPGFGSDEYFSLKHTYTHNLPETHEIFRSWRKLFDDHLEKTGKYIYMVLEAWDDDIEKWMSFYHSGADMPFNFLFAFNLNSTCNAKCISNYVDTWLSNMPKKKWANWLTGNHDQPRIGSRMGKQFTKLLNVLLLTLPGTPTTYYGEEIGMQNIEVSFEDTQDPFGRNYGKDRYQEVSRDPCRSPMQWNSEKNAGFSNSSKTWLPVHPGYKTLNVEKQNSSIYSDISLYRELIELRQTPSIQYGSLNTTLITDNVYTYVRWIKGVFNAKFIIILNLGSEKEVLDFHNMPKNYRPLKHFPKKGKVVIDTLVTEHQSRVGEEVQLNQVLVMPEQALIIRFY